MSINKQLYFGILGITSLFCVLCLLLILLSCIKIFITYKLSIQTTFNDLDTNIGSLNLEYSDTFLQLMLQQGKFESYFLRNYYNILSSSKGMALFDILDLNSSDINSHFIYNDNYNNSDTCKSEDSKCYFIFKNEEMDNDFCRNLLLKQLYIILPTLEVSLNTFSFNKDNFPIFNKFHFYDNQCKFFISYKYNKGDIEKDFNPETKPSEIKEYIFMNLINRAESIEKLNNLKISETTYNIFFYQNIFFLFAPEGQKYVLDPFNKINQQSFHFSSFNFKNDQNEKINDINEINQDNLVNYLSLDIKLNSLHFMVLNFINMNGNFLYILGHDLSFSACKSICKLNDYWNEIYSDNSINDNLILDPFYLKLNDFQFLPINQCFNDINIQKIVSSDLDYEYKLKVLYDSFKYNYERDINNKIQFKIIRDASPNRFVFSFFNFKFLLSFSYYMVLFKPYNNIVVMMNIVDRIIYRYIAYIMLFDFILWFIVFIIILIKLYLIADRISSPIRKLIKNISLSQGNFHLNGDKLEQIYYQEDKDINDLFQLCQKLIIGGFKKKINVQKKNKLNVYNNISKVKTNNMAINENQIIMHRNQKYNEIFEKGEDKEKIKDSFKQDIYCKYKDKDFDNKIKNYELKYIKKLDVNKKEEINNMKDKVNEYKMFYYINKEIEDFMPYNSLYKFYFLEFSKKNKKKKK